MIVTILIFIVGVLLGVIGYNYFNKNIKANNINWGGLFIENYEDDNQNVEIKSSEDVITVINNMQKKLYVLSAALIALSKTSKQTPETAQQNKSTKTSQKTINKK